MAAANTAPETGKVAIATMSARRTARWSQLASRWRQSVVGIAGTIVIAAILFIAAFAPLIAPYDPAEHHRAQRFLPPAWMVGGEPSYLLGTDQLGRDILSRILFGSRISVTVGISAVLVSGTIGVTAGFLAGYFGGRVDLVVSRLLDVFLAVPFIILTLAVIGVLGPNLITIIFVLGVSGWATFARVVRGEVLSVKQREYVLAAQVTGAAWPRIAFRHVLPNIAASIIVLATLDVASVILAESSLSYLGLGVQPPTVTWGTMIADGREYLTSVWWLATFPGMAIMFTVLGIILLGDWLRDVLDPKLK